MADPKPLDNGPAATLGKSPEAERVEQKEGKRETLTPRPDATKDMPVTDPVANQTPMEKPVTDAPAYAGPKNEDMPTPAEQAAPTESDHPLADGVEVLGHAPVLGAPIGVNPTVPQAAHLEADDKNGRFDVTLDHGIDNDVLVPMRHPDGGSADAFDTDDDGNALVPLDQAEALATHGFVIVQPEEDK